MTERNDGGPDDGLAADVGPAWTSVTQRHFDPDTDGDLTTALVFTIAEAEGVDPTALKSPPLYEIVDAPALQQTFFGPDIAGDSRQGAGAVGFRYNEYLVNVRSDGWIQVYEQSSGDYS